MFVRLYEVSGLLGRFASSLNHHFLISKSCDWYWDNTIASCLCQNGRVEPHSIFSSAFISEESVFCSVCLDDVDTSDKNVNVLKIVFLVSKEKLFKFGIFFSLESWRVKANFLSTFKQLYEYFFVPLAIVFCKNNHKSWMVQEKYPKTLLLCWIFFLFHHFSWQSTVFSSFLCPFRFFLLLLQSGCLTFGLGFTRHCG